MAPGNHFSDTLDERDNSFDEQSARVADSRLAAYHRGKVQAIPLNEVMAQSLVKLAWVKIPK